MQRHSVLTYNKFINDVIIEATLFADLGNQTKETICSDLVAREREQYHGVQTSNQKY